MKKAHADFTEPFAVSDRIRELAKQNGWPNPDSEVDAFIDYHEASGWRLKSGLKIVDREAAFRTWLRNAVKFNRRTQAPASPARSAGMKVWPTCDESQRRENLKRLSPMLSELAEKLDVRRKA